MVNIPSHTRRTVLLPQELNQQLDCLTLLVQEVKGVLFYRLQGDYCPLEYLLMTGVGTAGHVVSDPRRLKVVNEFFSRNTNYHCVEFHTHSAGTIDKYGRWYAQHFSEGDRRTIATKINEDSQYIHLLVTPETKLLCGVDNPQLQIVNGFSDYLQRKYVVDIAIQRIAQEKGYTFERLEAVLAQL